MTNKILLIVPSRKRQDKIVNFYLHFKNHSSITDLCIGLDDDDEINYPRFDNVIYEINPNMNLSQKLNYISTKYVDKYQYIAFMGDDHWIRTDNWDIELINSISDINNGIAYGDDLFQGQNLPTFVLMDSGIVKTLGYMCPPEQIHLYLDNFWKDLGTRLGTLRYVPSVIVEHMHYVNNKASVDEMYELVNSNEMYIHDEKKYTEYINDQFEKDVQRLS